MTCTNCTTRILRSLITEIPSTASPTIHPRRLPRLPRTTIRHTSSSTAHHQSADLSVNLDNNVTPATDFLGMYSTAKKSANKEALATWGTSWKTETDLSSMRDHEIRMPEFNGGNGDGKLEKTEFMEGYSYLDDFKSLPPKAVKVEKPEPALEPSFASSTPPLSFTSRRRRDRKPRDDDPGLNRIPPSLKSQFPTRSSSSEIDTEQSSDEIPWENPSHISKKIATGHNPTANAWKEWSTPALWSHARMQELYKPRTLSNGIRVSKHAALNVNAGQLNWNPSSTPSPSLDKYKTMAGVPINHSKKIYDKNTPTWKIHMDSVKSKLKGDRWNPFGRLSPAAVATLKQLKQENPGMTVEEYAPIFKISPDALRRILKSKWMPTTEQEADRNERWKRRGKAVWQQWEEKGLVQKKKVPEKKVQDEGERLLTKREEENKKKGFVVSRGLNLKRRIL
ncbi:Required for respiratory growth protein 9 mitochondrial [Arthrobotrys conoides]|uniref:Required for respiratory growth protein 9, mitochondrial n=1 Tax=Arthrobotrys conoides TaxID=74498 RepID=A0AAN8NLC9_9PEZI